MGGLGTTSPSHKLHVVSSGTDTAFFKGRIIRFDGAAASDSQRLNLSLDGTDKTSLMFIITDNSFNIETLTAAPIIFDTNSTERMRINSSGVVSIGTTSPNGSASKLQVEDSGENNVYFVGNTSTLGARLILQNKNSTANAFSKVEGADASGQGVASIKFINVNDGNNEGAITLETRPSGGLPTERMRIDSSGRVLVGTTTYGETKEVNINKPYTSSD